MNMLSASFESVAVLLGIGVIGFAIVARRVLPESVLGVLSPLAIDIAVPCMVAASIFLQFNPAGMPGWYLLPLWWLGFTAFMAVPTALVMRLVPADRRPEFGMGMFYPNAIFVPLALLSGMFGDNSLRVVELFLFTLFYPAFFFNTYHLFYRRKTKGFDWKKALNPILLATIAALALRLSGGHEYIPRFAVTALKSVGAMSIPLVMIIIGGNIYVDFRKRGRLYLSDSLAFVCVKNIALPLLTLLFVRLISPPPHVAFLMVMEAAVPPITALPLVAAREGGNTSLANQLMIASFLASVVTLPAMLWLYAR